MSSNPAGRNDLIVGAAIRLLEDVDPRPFSPEALNRLHEHVASFIDDMIMESIHVMKRHRATQIAQDYVDVAIANLRQRHRNLVTTIAKVAGGALLGFIGAEVMKVVRSGTGVPTQDFVLLVSGIVTGIAILSWAAWRAA